MYDTVNRNMVVDADSGSGDWPAGLRFHAGGAKPGGCAGCCPGWTVGGQALRRW